MQGWAGKILDIDLTSGQSGTMPLDPEIARLFLGGRGLGARLLWDLVGPDVDPLSPENVLIFTTGPITASASQTSSRRTSMWLPSAPERPSTGPSAATCGRSRCPMWPHRPPGQACNPRGSSPTDTRSPKVALSPPSNSQPLDRSARGRD